MIFNHLHGQKPCGMKAVIRRGMGEDGVKKLTGPCLLHIILNVLQGWNSYFEIHLMRATFNFCICSASLPWDLTEGGSTVNECWKSR